METIDNRVIICELDEIFKYKNLIDSSDNLVIKEIIFDGEQQSKKFYADFIKLVANEVDHLVNKAEFGILKEKLIAEMKQYLANKKS
ncbi:MAG: hypothetical protein JKY42_04390 [Flavobacteriales bacterium]|nr:hypothetical protein [Flavobacteriales bacterium]